MANVLIIGSGAREHALAWKLRQSPHVSDLYFAPGNDGMSKLGTRFLVGAECTEMLAEFAVRKKIDLTIVGSEHALAKGITRVFRTKDLVIFGPCEKAMMHTEGSKILAKEIMLQAGIPTGMSYTPRHQHEALGYIHRSNPPWWIKADGLADGKGAVFCKTMNDATEIINSFMSGKQAQEAGKKIVIEDALEGNEVSIHAICDVNDYIMCPAVRDHKRQYDGNIGLNTGGMGSAGPVTLNDATWRTITQETIEKMLHTLRECMYPFTGTLFPGIMLTKDGPRVLEYNARFGDPETQVLMHLLESDLYKLLYAAATNKLNELGAVRWRPGGAICIVATGPNYPQEGDYGSPISGIEEAEKVPGVQVFCTGVKEQHDGTLCTNGGRILSVTCCADDFRTAHDRAYEAMRHIYFRGIHYRKDIGESLLLPSSP
jgi:phosphoribosylamine--glycine ligase